MRILLFFLFLIFVNKAIAQTQVVKNLANPSSIDELAKVNTSLFFTATDGTNGVELWVSNGTSSGTVMVKDINPGSANSNPSNLTNVGGILFFNADNGTNGKELWRSDGTSVGTYMVKDIYAGASSSDPMHFAEMGGILYFNAYEQPATYGNELWRSDGTSVGTYMVKDLYPGISSSQPRILTNCNGIIYFRASGNGIGEELWKTDGTSIGTVLVKDINTGSASSTPNPFFYINGLVYFTAIDATNGRELWATNGTDGGTYLVKDIRPGSSSSSVSDFVGLSNKVYFSANKDGNGSELWTSDGTSGGTSLVKSSASGGPSSLQSLVSFGSNIYFTAYNGTYSEFWKSNGTSGGTVIVRSSVQNPSFMNQMSPTNTAVVNGQLYMAGYYFGYGYELWKSNGTDAGTVIVADIYTGSNSSTPSQFVNIGSTVYFLADNGINGMQLWKTDGVPVITLPTAVIEPDLDGALKIYPVPNNDGNFIIETEEQIEKVVLINALGHKEEYTSEFIHTEMKGVIMLHIHTMKGILHNKILIME